MIATTMPDNWRLSMKLWKRDKGKARPINHQQASTQLAQLRWQKDMATNPRQR
jgi:hypothetical protein